MKVCIVVPVYKDFNLLSNGELVSLHQLFKILGYHKIFLVGPQCLEYEAYLKEGLINKVSVKVEHFPKEYFDSLDGYNRLMISPVFYKRFDRFKYVLIYQLDAYVFSDELKDWCNKGYDYIGAPWTGIYLYKNKPLLGVGNGGFSLRNVKRSLQLLRTLRLFELLYTYRLLGNKSIILRLPKIVLKLGKSHKLESKFEKGYCYSEDIFWCKGVKERINRNEFNSSILKIISKIVVHFSFKIAPVEIASRFSTEVDSKRHYELNNKELPFGCHAWEKYEPEFWKEFIILKDYCPLKAK